MSTSNPRIQRHLQKIVLPIVIACILIVLWQALIDIFKVPTYIVPSPGRTVSSLFNDWHLLGWAAWYTLKVTLMALCSSIILGVLISFVFVQNRLIETALFPYIVLLQVTPIVAIAPLIIIWVNNTLAALVVCATLVAIFPVISNTTLGLRSVNPGLMAYFRLQGASRLQILLRLRVPAALPHFFAALRIASGLSLIGAVVAEFVAGTGGTNSGLAFQILEASYQLDIPRMFAALVLISAIGIGLFLVTSALSHIAIGRWHEIDQS